CLVPDSPSLDAIGGLATRADGASQLPGLSLHRIGPPQRELVGRNSAMERSRAWLLKLFAAGRAASRQFLGRHGADVGVRETLDVARAYSDAHKPKVRMTID